MGINTPAEIKIKAIAMLRAGEKPSVIAKECGVTPFTVRRWKREAGLTGNKTGSTTMPPPTEEEIREQCAELKAKHLAEMRASSGPRDSGPYEPKIVPLDTFLPHRHQNNAGTI